MERISEHTYELAEQIAEIIAVGVEEHGGNMV